MADLAAGGIAHITAWYNGWKKDVINREVTVTLAAMGTAANAVPAASFGFSKFRGIAYLTKSDNTEVILGVPSYDGTKLLLKAAATNAPADFTGTYHGVVAGI